MNYTKIENEKYNLHIIQTDKFKTVTVSINFKRKLTKQEITKRNILVNALLEGTLKIPSKRLLEIKTEELYDLAYRCANSSSGKFTIFSFEMTYINPKYTEENMSDESFKFLSELIYDVNVDDGKISKKNFDIAKKTVEDCINTLSEDVATYSQIRMLEEMEDSLISYRNCGYSEDLEKITSDDLYEYYLDIINNDAVDIFVVGDVEVDDIKSLIDKYYHFSSNNKTHESHFYIPKSLNDKVKFVSEKVDKEQSTLVVGFKIDEMTDFEKRYVSAIYNYILGGSTESNLFQTVREQNSLCYYITSSNQPLLSIGTIRSGINASNYEHVISLIHQELENIKCGKFDESKIENAKITYLSGLSDLEDNPRGIVLLYTGIEYFNADNIEQRREKIVKVTKEDIIKLTSKIHLDTIFLLEGNDIDEKE